MKKGKHFLVGSIIGILCIMLFCFCGKQGNQSKENKPAKKTIADDFSKDNLKKVTVNDLEFSVPENWIDNTDDSVKGQSLRCIKEDNNGKVIAGFVVAYAGLKQDFIDDAAEITPEIVQNSISSDEQNVEEITTGDYEFESADAQAMIQYKNTDGDGVEWDNHLIMASCDGSVFRVHFYTKKGLEAGDKAVTKFFDGFNFAEYEAPRVLTKIEADYSGDTESGTQINNENEGIEVTAVYDDESTEIIDSSLWKIEKQGKLKADKTSKFKITYEDKSCTLKIKCSTESGRHYRSKCKSYSYSKIARYSSKYRGKRIRLEGKVLQVMGSSYRIAKDGDYDHVVYVTAYGVSTKGKILEDDYVTIYGECNGEETYETVLGASVTIPSVNAEYIIQ